MGVNKSYPTAPGVARRGVTVCGESLQNGNLNSGLRC